MQNRLRGGLIAIAAIAAGAVFPPSMSPSAAQAPAFTVPRTADGKPNLNGIWQALNTADWDLQAHAAQAGRPDLGAIGAVPPGLSVVEGNEIPYRPSALARQKENFEKRMTADPEIKCYLPGVPRATYQPFPFQIIQTPAAILISYEFASASRLIRMAQLKPAPVDSWMGQSSGRWEEDTLVVDVTGFNGEAWFDRAGNFASDSLHVIEHYTLISPDAVRYEATIEDPKVFTRPWTISMPLYRHLEKNAQLLEFKCVEFAEELLYGHLRRKTGK
jgi:hypothetical protein